MQHKHSHNHSLKSSLKKTEELCLTNGIKLTKLRRNILRTIWESEVPVKAYDILENIRKTSLSAKPITIYRVLDFLLENKLVHKLESQSAFIGCAHPEDKHNCYFIICTKCHKVEEGCKNDLLKPVLASLAQQNFIPSKIVLEIQGICSSCAGKIALQNESVI